MHFGPLIARVLIMMRTEPLSIKKLICVEFVKKQRDILKNICGFIKIKLSKILALEEHGIICLGSLVR